MNETGFWNNVKTLAKGKNQNLKWLSEEAQVPYNTLTNWITRDIIPNAIQSVSIAKALDTTVEYLVTGEDIPPDTADIHKEAVKQILNGVKVLADFYSVDL